MRCLYYGETPFISTGAGQVSDHLLPVLREFFSEIHVCAINQPFEVANLPEGLTITQASDEDLWASEQARRLIATCDYDLLFLTTDLNRITDLKEEIAIAHDAGIPVVMYAAMDTLIYQKSFWEVLRLADRAVVFSEWAKGHALRVLPDLQLEVIYHGCEPEIFSPISQEDRRKARQAHFGIDDSTFLVINVNRNQPRKDLARSMAAFHLFHLEYPDSLLYLHSKQSDLGGNLPGQAAVLGLSRDEIVFAPEDYNWANGCSREDLNVIYNCADVVISTSTGEGWGLTTTEAMAAGVPFIGPDNTVFPEILGKEGEEPTIQYEVGERGYLVESGGPDLWTVFYTVADNPRQLSSVRGMHEALAGVCYAPYIAKKVAKQARKWTEQHSWQKVQEEWRVLLREVTGDYQKNQARLSRIL